ncbi:MAG: hypothetical protein ACLS95_02845 [Clostridia bacterium]
MKKGTGVRKLYNAIVFGVYLSEIIGILFFTRVVYIPMIAFFSLDAIREIVDFLYEKRKIYIIVTIIDILMVIILLTF